MRGSALGFHYSVSSMDSDLCGFARAALRHLPPSREWTRVDATTVELAWRDGEVSVAVDGNEAFTGEAAPALARMMNVVNVGATWSARQDPVLHCGAVSVDGRAVLLPGRPGAGKSTTTTALLLRGLGYLSDEAAPLGSDLRVRPYPKPVVVGRGSWPSVAGAAVGRIGLANASMDAWWIDPLVLGSEIPATPLPVGAVVAPQYREGSPLRVQRLTRAEATALMASNTFNMHDHGIGGVERVARLTEGIPLLGVAFGDVSELCDLLLSEFGA